MAKRVLFINNSGVSAFIPGLLAGAGYEVSEVYDADNGLRRLESRSYDLTILLENSAAESWLLCGKIRSRATTPFIVISNGASTETCVKAINAGADFFMRKPFSTMELLARIKALFLRAPSKQPATLAS